MKIVISVCVYDRLDNIKEWIRCWKMCEQHNAELVIVHNYYGNETELLKFKSICDADNIIYIPRYGKGFDIGAFKEVCKETLSGFPDFDLLMWCCDDTLPMSKDFIQPFLDKLKQNIGIVCMEMSREIKLHFRTSGFLIRKETTKKLKFPDKVETKDDCYYLEHGSNDSFYCQIVKMGLRVLMVDTPDKSPLWDMGYLNRKRLSEHHLVFPKKSKVTFICPIFDAFPEIISSLICQTHKDWELILIDDNPKETTTKAIIEATKDNRITYIKRQRMAKWGHPHRQWALEEIKNNKLSKDADYIVITNGDNYYAPTFCEYMLSGFHSPNIIATYCKQTVHSYIAWKVMDCHFERGFLDCGQVMIKKNIACDIGWNDIDSHSSDWAFFLEIANKYGADNFNPVEGCIFCHN